MPKKTYTQINSITLAAASSSVTFGSIPQDFRDLILVVNGNVTGSLVTQLRFNSDSGNNYSFVSAAGNNNNSPYSTSGTTTFINAAPDFGTNAAFDQRYQIMDYSATDKHKTVLVRHGMSAQSPNMVAARWANTSAISALTFLSSANSYSIGTVISLYGIEA
jgi:hypothetical protein